MALDELYRSFQYNGELRDLLFQDDWLISLVDFDSRTGKALPLSLNMLLHKISEYRKPSVPRDRLCLLVEHSWPAFKRIVRNLNEEPRRESANLPIRDVKELDMASFVALSRRPGRNIREKLADKPYMQAVRHFQSIDVPENRLLKAYVTRLAYALELRNEFLHDVESSKRLEIIYRWLRQDEVKEISQWENLAPNNTLLSHRDYRRIWNSWQRLQSLEHDIDREIKHISERRQILSEWETRAGEWQSGSKVFADMPVEIDFDSFVIKPWDETLPSHNVKDSLIYDRDLFTTDEPACIDLTQIQPVFATPSQTGKLHEKFFWQRWQRKDTLIDLELFESNAIYLHSDAFTITCSDLFFYKGKESNPAFNQAAHSFLSMLKKHFIGKNLVWLVPDCLNDFELEILRRNINSFYSYAVPLPCSVAAVFACIDYKMIDHDGYKVAVIERTNGVEYVTEMIACFNEELREKLPETNGYIWEKGVTEVLRSDIEDESVCCDVFLLKENGEWTREFNPYGAMHKSDRSVIVDDEQFDCVIKLSGRPVSGGIKLYQLQKLVEDIPLWRSHIPMLQAKVFAGGKYGSFTLVGKNVTMPPIRGRAIPIKISEKFTLPRGEKTYHLPLLQGDSEAALEYEAKLISSDFPYKEDVQCRLNMTYTYGADDPYHLIFEPLDQRYAPVKVIWHLKEDMVIDNAPAPSYPTSLNWSELQHQFNPNKNENEDLLDWALDASQRLDNILRSSDGNILEGVITSDWKENAKGNRYTFARSEKSNEDFYINEYYFADREEISRIAKDVKVYFVLEKKDDRTLTRYVSLEARKTSSGFIDYIIDYIHKALYVPFIHIWSDGRSLSNPECPPSFREIKDVVQSLSSLVTENKIQDKKIKQEVIFLLSCLGKDMPISAVAYIDSLAISKNIGGKINERPVGFALGDLSTSWQLKLFREILNRRDGSSLRILAHAIWRYEGFIQAFSVDDLRSVLQCLQAKIKKNLRNLLNGGIRESLLENLSRYLELLLGLLRTRESNDKEIHMLLQPGQYFTVQFAELVDSLIDNAVEHGDEYFTRLQFDTNAFLGRLEDDRTPDLLYCLRLYLKGDSSAHAIRVTGVNDE